MPVETITSRAELMKLLKPAQQQWPRRHKMNAQQFKVGKHSFPSKLEAARYCELRVLESRGEINNLQCQVSWALVDPCDGDRGVSTRLDFQYEKNGKLVVEDTKGWQTQDSKNKMKVFRDRYGFAVRIVKMTAKQVNQTLALWGGVVEGMDAVTQPVV
jgi:hypothetical protein